MFAMPGVLPLAEINFMWHAVPLIVAISLVYSATHHERLRPIFENAARLGAMITGFMLAIAAVLALVSAQL
jgi:hypothetical protein